MWGTDQAIRVAQRNANVYLESSSASSLALRKVLRDVGPERLLIGTDSPFFDFEVEMLKVKLAVPDPAAQALVLGGNAERLFGGKEGAVTGSAR